MIQQLFKEHPLKTNMITEEQVGVILSALQAVVEMNIPGDVVELGCHMGSTSFYIQALLMRMNCKKRFHVYDSFMGLPDKHEFDGDERKYRKGDCQSTEEAFVEHFISRRIAIPEVHSGWFAEIPDEEYPDKICFAFLDSDFYTSITDSWQKIYHKLSKGAVVCIHDYNWDPLPGVQKACHDFLKDKPEHGSIKNMFNVGIMVKL